MSVPPALAAETDQSEALGRVINTDVLALDLANAGTSQSGNLSDPGPNSQPLNVDLLNENLALDLGSLTLPLLGTAEERGLLDLGEAGALSSYTESLDATTSTASAGAVGDGGGLDLDGIENGTYGSANVDLTDLLAQAGVDGLTDDIVDELSLQLGALGSTATANGEEVTSEYVVADGQLVISSPLVGDLSTELNSALTDVGTVLNGAVGADGALGQVTEAIAIDTDLGVASVKAGGGTIGLIGLDAALDEASTSLLAEPLEDSNGLVKIDLVNGTIAVDLQALGGPDGLNGLPANTELLDSETIGLITGAVTEALGTVTTKVGEILVDDVFNNVGLRIELPAEIRALIATANVDIVVETTLGQLAGTDDSDPTIEIDGNLLGIPLGSLLSALEPVVETAVITPLQGVIGGVVDTATTGLTSTLDGLIQPVLDTLSPVLSGVLTQVVSVTINEQPEPGYLGEDSFTVNALSLELLPNLAAVNVDLASSTVRVSDVVAEDPALSVDPGTVNDGDTTEVTGENYPPNTDVDVQLVDPDGNPVGDPVTVTTDENGGFTAELLVPEGSDAGDYTVEGTATTGETATTDLGVTNDSDDDNAAENGDDNDGVNGDDNGGVNGDDNDGVNGDDNDGVNGDDNDGVNGDDNDGVNGDDNDGVNGDDNDGVNGDDNDGVNGDDNDGVNGDDNDGVNGDDNDGVNGDDNDGVNGDDNAADGDDNAADGDDNAADGDDNAADGDDNAADGDDNAAVNGGDNAAVNGGDNAAVNGGDNAAEDGTTDPTITVDPDTAAPGDSITVDGENFPPNSEVELQLTDSDGNPVGDPVTVVTDDDGAFSTELEVLEGTEPGDYTIVATDEDGNSATADLTVTGSGSGADNSATNSGESSTGGSGLSGGGSNGSGSTVSGSSGGSGSLAQTGAAGTAAMVGLAALLVVAGAAGLLVSRRSAL
ncbi:hypothetical protein CIK81_07665 [Brachybacterium sp. JB7]|uniref:choice-of-anchor G family protein n=1 Tax=Brachybacterium sp. JB7 TaxID=2024478 RepID=UPI000DF23184|nr:choice-of-anchor G family protein [Brachybacterium sp. JB7]RCS65166.1 hypothetical protein CIK81_07665 [Brachybacterium sp. JB7]